jgi:hypothetical protein
VRRRFACPGCKTTLKASTAVATILAVVIWSLADAAIAPYLYSAFGFDWQAVVIRVLAGGAVAVAALYFLLGRFGSVEAER